MDIGRRGFLGALAASLTLDPERLLWVPGKKTISIPKGREPLIQMIEFYFAPDPLDNSPLFPITRLAKSFADLELKFQGRDFYEVGGQRIFPALEDELVNGKYLMNPCKSYSYLLAPDWRVRLDEWRTHEYPTKPSMIIHA